jgi:hypothetical protein
MLISALMKSKSHTQNHFNHAIKLTIRERDRAELEQLSDRLDALVVSQRFTTVSTWRRRHSPTVRCDRRTVGKINPPALHFSFALQLGVVLDNAFHGVKHAGKGLLKIVGKDQ